MAGILKVDKYQDFNGNDIMTSDGSGNVTSVNATDENSCYSSFLHQLSARMTIYNM